MPIPLFYYIKLTMSRCMAHCGDSKREIDKIESKQQSRPVIFFFCFNKKKYNSNT